MIEPLEDLPEASSASAPPGDEYRDVLLPAWVAKAFHMFAWMAPGEVETFRLGELGEAKEWAAG